MEKMLDCPLCPGRELVMEQEAGQWFVHCGDGGGAGAVCPARGRIGYGLTQIEAIAAYAAMCSEVEDDGELPKEIAIENRRGDAVWVPTHGIQMWIPDILNQRWLRMTLAADPGRNEGEEATGVIVPLHAFMEWREAGGEEEICEETDVLAIGIRYATGEAYQMYKGRIPYRGSPVRMEARVVMEGGKYMAPEESEGWLAKYATITAIVIGAEELL